MAKLVTGPRIAALLAKVRRKSKGEAAHALVIPDLIRDPAYFFFAPGNEKEEAGPRIKSGVT
ncbi:hypothetical protein [Sphingomonas yantingensis]|jgi:hypothetical protein|uniref:Uncharacterized protein n=1 Tax=Sphingomonas yantingensis TaxID=1241761 RepID=A0A7W9AQW8_9SPHN|nr:hypothetical protein [Sphingomonas yantingensis]MBB5698964.1 hypothetical protein [Sphingomonas yantingensis]